MNPSVDQQQLLLWLGIIIRGVTMRKPEAVQIRQHKRWLLVSVTFELPEGEPPDEPRDYAHLAIENCRKWQFTPESDVRFVDFGDEWPPYKFMRSLDKPQLVGLNGGKLNG